MLSHELLQPLPQSVVVMVFMILRAVLVVLVVLAVVHPSVQTTSTQTLVLVVDNNQANLEFQVPLVGVTVQTQHLSLVVTMVLLAVVLVVRTVHLMVFQNHSYQQVAVTSPQHS